MVEKVAVEMVEIVYGKYTRVLQKGLKP